MPEQIDLLTESPIATIRTLIFNLSDAVLNLFGDSATTQTVDVAEVASPRTPVSEAEVMFGPSSVDEDLLAQLDALRQQGFPALPGAAALDS